MTPRGSWYFDGYRGVRVPRKNGRGHRTVLVYAGEWYSLQANAETVRRLKQCSLLLTCLTLGSNLTAQLTPQTGGMVHWMAIPSLLSLVPAIYLVMGLVSFLAARGAWPVRVYYAGYRRMQRAAVCYLVPVCVWVLLEAWFLIRHPALFGEELPYFLLLLASAGSAALLVQLTLSHRVEVTPSSQPPDPEIFKE